MWPRTKLQSPKVTYINISKSNLHIEGKVVVHSIPPYAMAWSSSHICVAGPDKKVVFYTMDGMMAQQFDYFRWTREDNNCERIITMLILVQGCS